MVKPGNEGYGTLCQSPNLATEEKLCATYKASLPFNDGLGLSACWRAVTGVSAAIRDT